MASSRSPTARNATPRGASSHLYAEQETASNRLASSGSQPTACGASTTGSAAAAAAASTSASKSATAPLDDWTALKSTAAVVGSTLSASRSSGTLRTVTPRSAWIANG